MLDKFTFIVILLNFYITGLRSCILTFKTKGGIFDNDKYVPIIESVVNLVASIILAKLFGLVGIFLGTTISTIAIPFWLQPKLVYNNIFNKSFTEYFKKYFIYLIITLFTGIITTIICSLININNLFISLLIKGIVCVIIINFIFIIFLFNTNEFKYILKLIKNIFEGFLLKLQIKIN